MIGKCDQMKDSAGKTFGSFIGIETELTAEGLFALGNWFDECDFTDKALEFYQKALEADSGLAAAHHNMGVIFAGLQRQERAVHHFEKAIKLDPGLAASYAALGMHWFAENRFEQALVLLKQSVIIDPQFAEGHFNMGIILQQMGDYDRSLASFQKASACNPGFAPARWLHKLCLPVLYNTSDEITSLRRRFCENLDELIGSVPLDTPERIDDALQGIKSTTNFYLPYQGFNDLELQKKYGRWIHRIMVLRFPQWAACPARPMQRPGEKIRVGYISAFMNHHTVGTFLAGWVENHDTDAFEVYCYHIGAKTDDLTRHLNHHSSRFYHLSGDLEAAAAQIAADQLHILVYNEIGMSIDAMLLAALRLAPVQCVGWGHPVTTGLPTIDYFLSSDLMEPTNADQHYTERLIRLPNLSLCYHPPRLPEEPMGRKALGLPTDRFIFLSSQSVFKYLPQHDDIFPLIAQQAPNAYFVFISHRNPHVTALLQKRLRRAFEHRRLDFDRYCRFTPRLAADEFLSLNMAADAYLDTFEWSGGKTTLEAISCGLPVVTCPGRFMRGRHAYAMLKMMGIDETIAYGIDEYGAIASRLATDNDYFNKIRSIFNEHRHKIYHDKACIGALERHYRNWARVMTRQKATPLEESEYWFHKANGHLKNGSPHEAIAAYEKVVALRPDWDAVHYNLAVAFRSAEQLSDAIPHAKEAIRINPAYNPAYPLLFRLAQHVCDWPLAEKSAAHLEVITRQELADGIRTTEPPLTNIRRTADLKTNLQVARSWSQHQLRAQRRHCHPISFQHLDHATRPMRIGYLSGDFKDHAVAYQVRGLFEGHDRNRFEIYGYACNPDNGSPYRRKLVQGCDRFTDVHQWSNEAVAKQIHGDGIQILVDLSGHSKGNRLGIAAMRPAPVQVSYLGFLGTTGADFIDYVLADRVVLPEEHLGYYSEKIVYLPHYQVNDDRLPIPEKKSDRRKWGLPADAFVFCSFNQSYKIDARLFQTWMRILKHIDNSVLWLVERDRRAVENLKQAAENAKVDPSRLIFAGFVPMGENLSRLQLADLVLDTVSYNGGATTSNALWAGVPVVAVLGKHWVSRMSASALHCLGLPELIAEGLDGYEQLAVELASNPRQLMSIRQKLQHQRSSASLFDTALFTRQVEKAYCMMWERFLQGMAPETFQVMQ